METCVQRHKADASLTYVEKSQAQFGRYLYPLGLKHHMVLCKIEIERSVGVAVSSKCDSHQLPSWYGIPQNVGQYLNTMFYTHIAIGPALQQGIIVVVGVVKSGHLLVQNGCCYKHTPGQDKEGRDEAKQGKTREDRAGKQKAGQRRTRQDETRQNKARQSREAKGRTTQDKAGQGRTR